MRTTMKKLIPASLLLSAALLVAGSAYSAPLYFPHIAANAIWQTEIALINSGSQSVTGTLKAYSDAGGLPVDTEPVTLAARGRREIIVADVFTNHTSIGYIVFEADSDTVQGYTKFYRQGMYRAAIPAVRDVNTSDIYVSHIASNAEWWTGISLVNTTAAAKTLTFNFSDGRTHQVTLDANEHKAFAIKDLFNNEPQPSIESAVITNAGGVIGLELFATYNGQQMEGILLTDRTATSLYFPYVLNDNVWWTGIAAYNPSSSPCDITVTSYDANGTYLASQTGSLSGGQKYNGTTDHLGLPAQTAWFRIDSTGGPLSGFELIGTLALDRLASHAGNGGTGAKAGIFAKIEKHGGKTDIALVNTENSTASVTLNAYTDDGIALPSSSMITIAGHAAMRAAAADIIGQNIANATYIAYTSDRDMVGLQLNYSADGTMLDGLPALGVINGGDNGVSSGGPINPCSDGTQCVSPTCSSISECQCPAGMQLCGHSCIPADASCCHGGSYCAGPATCGSDGACTDDGTGVPSGAGVVPGMTYHMFANGCPGGIIYGYTGPNYTICNWYATEAFLSLCSEVIDGCH